LGCQVKVSDIYEGAVITMPYSSFMGKTIQNENYQGGSTDFGLNIQDPDNHNQ